MSELNRFLPYFIAGLLKTKWASQSDIFKKEVKFEDYREGFFHAFEVLDLVEYNDKI